MSHWCMGARRRAPAHGDADFHDLELADDRSKGASTSASASRERDLRGDGKMFTRGKMSSEQRELEHARGTRRARVCIAVTCALLIALSASRPVYAPYIDVFGEPPGAATPPPPPPPPPARKGIGSWARRLGKFG